MAGTVNIKKTDNCNRIRQYFFHNRRLKLNKQFKEESNAKGKNVCWYSSTVFDKKINKKILLYYTLQCEIRQMIVDESLGDVNIAQNCTRWPFMRPVNKLLQLTSCPGCRDQYDSVVLVENRSVDLKLSGNVFCALAKIISCTFPVTVMFIVFSEEVIMRKRD